MKALCGEVTAVAAIQMDMYLHVPAVIMGCPVLYVHIYTQMSIRCNAYVQYTCPYKLRIVHIYNMYILRIYYIGTRLGVYLRLAFMRSPTY